MVSLIRQIPKAGRFSKEMIQEALPAFIIPTLQKSEGFRFKAPRVKTWSISANPWHRRTFGPPTLPKSKKDDHQLIRSSSKPLEGGHTRREFNTHKDIIGFAHLFCATIGSGLNLTLRCCHNRENFRSVEQFPAAPADKLCQSSLEKPIVNRQQPIPIRKPGQTFGKKA